MLTNSSIPMNLVVLVVLLVSGRLFYYYCVRYNLPSSYKEYQISSKDIALITGGSGGLGSELIKQMLSKGVQKIYNLDLKLSVERDSRIDYRRCDVGNESELKQSLDNILSELKEQNRNITILINNAGIRHSQSLLDLPDKEIHDIFNVNTFSFIWTLRKVTSNHIDTVFKQDTKIDRKLRIVNVSSILGALAPRNLSLYSATKSAIVLIHESLTQELLEYPEIRLLLVTPGQLSTGMFKDVEPSRTFLAPIISAEYLARRIVEKINVGESGVYCEPLYANFLPGIRVFPMVLQHFCRWFSEMDTKVNSNSKRGNERVDIEIER